MRWHKHALGVTFQREKSFGTVSRYGAQATQILLKVSEVLPWACSRVASCPQRGYWEQSGCSWQRGSVAVTVNCHLDGQTLRNSVLKEAKFSLHSLCFCLLRYSLLGSFCCHHWLTKHFDWQCLPYVAFFACNYELFSFFFLSFLSFPFPLVSKSAYR